MKLKTAEHTKVFENKSIQQIKTNIEAERRPRKRLGVLSRQKEINHRRIRLPMDRSFALPLGTRRGVSLLQIAGMGSDKSGMTGRAGGTR